MIAERDGTERPLTDAELEKLFLPSPDPPTTTSGERHDDRHTHARLDEVTVVDVREDEEWAAGHIAGAVHIPLDSSKPASVIWTRTRRWSPPVAAASAAQSATPRPSLTAAAAASTPSRAACRPGRPPGLPITTDDGAPRHPSSELSSSPRPFISPTDTLRR